MTWECCWHLDAPKRPTTHRTAPATQTHQVQNVSSAEAENPWCGPANRREQPCGASSSRHQAWGWGSGDPRGSEAGLRESSHLDHLMFALPPATTHSNLAVSPSGTVRAEGSPAIVRSPEPKDEALSATMLVLRHLASEATGPGHPSTQDCTLPRTLSWTHRWSRSCPL